MNIAIQTGDIVDRLGIEEGYKAIGECGFTAIDWNLDHAVKRKDLENGSYKGKSILERPLDEVIDYYAQELAVIRKNGLVITQAHAPFPAYIPARPEILDYMIEIFKRNIEYCDYCGCKNLVIHGISLGMTDLDNTPESIYNLNLKLYTSLIPTLQRTNVTVCLEDLFTGYNGFCFAGHCADGRKAAEFIDLLNDRAGKECFGLCFDVGHCNLLRLDFREYIPILGKRIKCLHIHDNGGIKDNHMAPLTGTVNWTTFCEAMKQIGYENDLSFETFAQTNKVLDFDAGLLIPWMNLIYATGEVLRKRISL